MAYYQQDNNYILNIRRIFTYLIVFYVWHSSIQELWASKNKESYILQEENFSKDKTINFRGLYNHIHYTFGNEDLLKEALYPLLPTKLQLPKKKFDHLEFLGDGVLDLIMRQRILELFPDQERGLHDRLVKLLVENKTLAEIYSHNLEIERYLPFPGQKECKYCNMVEALIGAIYLDNPKRGLTNARKFIVRILDDHILEEKLQEVLNDLKSESKKSKKKLEVKKLIERDFPISSQHKKIIDDIFKVESSRLKDSKSLLSEILTKIWDDRPSYIISLGMSDNDGPIFIANVTAAQIGHVIQGSGFTTDEAEQSAAREAINFLAQHEILLEIPRKPHVQSYTKFVNEYLQLRGINSSSKLEVCTHPHDLFQIQVKDGDTVIGTGTGATKKAAKEAAAREACQYLIENNKVKRNALDLRKPHISILKEWQDQRKISSELEFSEAEKRSAPGGYKFTVIVNTSIKCEGMGASSEEAKERAYHKLFMRLLERQEKALEEKESLRLSSIKSKPFNPKTLRNIP